MRTAVALVGVPAVGKTTVMRSLLADNQMVEERWERVSYLREKKYRFGVLGIYREGETFAGTDRMSMSIQPEVERFLVEHWKDNIVFEGDRLCNLSFFRFLSKLPDTRLMIIFMTAGASTLAKRHKQREDDQTKIFLKSRETKVNNLKGAVRMMATMDSDVQMAVFPHESASDTKTIVDHIRCHVRH